MIESPWPPFEDLQTIWGISYRGWHVVTHTCMWCDQQVLVEQTSSSVCLGNLFFLELPRNHLSYIWPPLFDCSFFGSLTQHKCHSISCDLLSSDSRLLYLVSPPYLSRRVAFISRVTLRGGSIVHLSMWFHFRSPQWLLIKRSNPITPFTSKHLMRTRSRFPQRSATNKSIDP